MKFRNLLWGILICAVTCSIVGCAGSIEERADAGDPEAQRLLAEIYEVGDSIHAQNADSAYFWYEKRLSKATLPRLHASFRSFTRVSSSLRTSINA